MWTVFTCTIHAEHTRNKFYRTLSIRGTNLIACWAYGEPISSHAEHARKCLKDKYLGRIKYDFQKSCVTGPWDHMVLVSAKKVKRKFHACVPLIFVTDFQWSVVSLILAINLSPGVVDTAEQLSSVTMTPVINYFWYQRHRWTIIVGDNDTCDKYFAGINETDNFHRWQRHQQ